MAVIDVLVAHHALIRVGGAGTGIIFQHQQIQEWYASFEVERVMRESAEGNSEAIDRLRRVMLDDPEWEEPILFAAERVSRDGEASIAAVAEAIESTMEIDPYLAADMISRSSPAVWDRVAVDVLAYCRRWRQDVSSDRATVFMVRTGRPEFADEVWKLILDPNVHQHLRGGRSATRLSVSVLGPEFGTRFAALSPEVRADVLPIVADHGDYEALELVTKLALADTDVGNLPAVIGHLAFRGADRFVAKILKASNEDIWEEIAERGYPDATDDPEVDRRLKEGRAAFLNAHAGPFEKIQSILDPHNPSPAAAAEIRTLLVEAPFSPHDSNSDHVIGMAFQRYPDAVAGALVDRLLARKPLPFRSARYLQAASAELEDGVLVDAVLDPAEDKKFATNAANVVGPTAIGKLIDELLALDAKWRADKAGLPGEDRDRIMAVADLIACTRPNALVRAFLARSLDTDPDSIARLADLFTRHGVDDSSKTGRLSLELETAMVERVIDWANTLLGAEAFARGPAASVARVIGRLKTPGLLPSLTRLLAADLVQRERSRQARSVPGLHQAEASNDAMMAHANTYRIALSAIGTDEAAQLLISYLPHVDVGFEAAVGLKEIWDWRNGIASPTLKPWPDFSIVRTRLAERASGSVLVVEASFATAIFTAIDALTTETSSEDQQGLAIGIARIAIGLPYKERVGLVYRLLSFVGHRSAKQLLLTALVMDGRTIPSNAVFAGIRDFLEELKTKSWLLPQNSWELEGWLELFAFSDRPAAALEALPLLPENYAAPHQLRRLLNALGNSPSDEAEEVLKAFADRDARFCETYEWVNALEQRGTVSATQYLLDQISNGAVKLGGHVPWDLSRSIAQTMERDPGARTEIYRRYTQTSGVPQQLIERAIAEAPDVEGLLLMVRIAAAAGRDFRRTELHKALRRALTEERPSTYMRGAQELHPVPDQGLRKALLAMTVGEESVAVLARRTLIEIDVMHDDYGWDGGDRRHPDIASGIPWPLAFIEASK